MLEELVSKLIPYIDDVSKALMILLWDVAVRILGILYIIASITPTDRDDNFLLKWINRITNAVGKGNGNG